MKKLLIGFFVFFAGVTLYVQAQLPKEVSYTYKMLSVGFEDLLRMNITDREEKRYLAGKFRSRIITEKELLKNLLLTGKITEADFFEIRRKYASLFVRVCEWGRGRN